MRRILLPLLLLLTGLLPARPQVFLPHRHPVASSAAVSTNPPFSSDLILWLSGASFASSNNADAINTWSDLTTNHHDFITQGIAAGSRPTVALNQLNSLPAVQFVAASTQFLYASNTPDFWAAGYTNYTIFYVLKNSTTNANYGLDGFAYNNVDYYPKATGQPNYTFYRSAGVNSGYPTTPLDAWHRMSCYVGHTNWQIFLNSQSQAWATDADKAVAGFPNNGYIFIGKSETGGGTVAWPWNGYIAEVLMYRVTFTNDVDRASVDSWLINKYALAQPAAIDPTTLTNSLVAYWRLDETNGTTYADVVGTNTLTATNSPSFTTGVITNALSCNLTNRNAAWAADSASLSAGNIDFTVACWFKLHKLGVTQMIATKGNTAAVGTFEWELYAYTDNTIGFFVSNGSTGGGCSSAAVQTNVWYCAIAWHDAAHDTVNLQLNYGNVAQVSYSSGSFDSTQKFSLGGDLVNASYAYAEIDEAGFWRRCLTTQERYNFWNKGVGRTYPFSQ